MSVVSGSQASGTPVPRPAQGKGSRGLGLWLALLALLVSNVPLFVCLPLSTDTVHYDLQARHWLHGGRLYDDYLEPNLPGIIWLHATLRPLIGWNSEALRLFDLLVFSGTVTLLVAWLVDAARTPRARAGLLLLFCTAYLSFTEWCHCQRDIWLLLPTLAAAHLRLRQIARLAEPAPPPSTTFAWGLVEGLMWGLALWIKPFSVLTALAVWVWSLLSVRRARPLLCDFAGLLAGGLLIGTAGIAVMLQTGTWEPFWTTLREWNPEYLAARREGWNTPRLVGTFLRFFPWSLAHVWALPWSVLVVARGLRALFAPAVDTSATSATTTPAPEPFAIRHGPMLALFYLSWMTHAVFLQHLFDYIYAPTTLLAVAIISLPFLRTPVRAEVRLLKWVGILLIAVTTPVLRPGRLAQWPACLAGGSTYETRGKLTLLGQVDWPRLAEVREFLQPLALKDQELTCYNSTLVYLYDDMRLRPSTRYAYLDCSLVFFKKKRAVIQSAITASPQKYIVTDLIESGMSASDIAAAGTDPTTSPPPRYPRTTGLYPWSHPVIFRAGRYMVHRLDRPPTAPIGRVLTPLIPTPAELDRLRKRQPPPSATATPP